MQEHLRKKRSFINTIEGTRPRQAARLKSVSTDEVLRQFDELLGATMISADGQTCSPSGAECGQDPSAADDDFEESGPSKHRSAMPAEIGEYQILERLGSGGMGVVYRAQRKGTSFEVALKVLPDALANDENCKKRIQQEATAASKLTHVNLVTIFENSHQETSYIAMELVEGQNLAQMLKQEQRLSLEQFQNVFSQVCDGLLHAHAKGVIHRDIKPGNILMTPDGIVKIADFGIARTLDAFDLNPQKTATHTVVGTPEYMSPEQCLGMELDVRSDIYSLGAVMFKALTGREVFEGNNPIQVIAKHLQEDPPSVRNEDASIPLPLAEVILRCLQKNPAHRYQNAGQVLLALKHAYSKPKSRLPLQFRLHGSARKCLKVGILSILAVVALCFGGAHCFLIKSVDTSMVPAQPNASTTVSLGAPEKSPETLEAEIRQWKLDLAATSDPAEKVLYARWIGDAYLTLVTLSGDYSLPVDSKRRAYALNAVKSLREAEALQLKVDPDDGVLDDIYYKLHSSAYYLDCQSDSLKYAKARIKFLERFPELRNDSLVSSYKDVGSAMSRLHYPQTQVIEAYRKSIEYDKVLHNARLGYCADVAYLDLIGELEFSGRIGEALDVADELIERLTARDGADAPLLSCAYETKAQILDLMKNLAEAKRERERAKKIRAASSTTGTPEISNETQRLEKEVEKAQSASDRAMKIAELINIYMSRASADEDTADAPLNQTRINLLGAAVRCCESYDKSIPLVKPDNTQRLKFYSMYFDALFTLERYEDAVKVAEKQCATAEAPHAVLGEEAVRAFTGLASVYLRCQKDPEAVDGALIKAINYNKKIYRNKVCISAIDAYCMLSDGLQADGDIAGAERILDEGIKKTTITFGRRSRCLSLLLERKLQLCQNQKSKRNKSIKTLISGLNKEYTQEEHYWRFFDL